jgi:predicted RND superfamily exporter protein
MLDRAVVRFAETVTRRRKLVIAAVVGVTVFCASQLPHLRPDPSPEKLMISYGGYEARAREFRACFGDSDSVVALLVAADDVTAQPILEYVHRLSLHFSDAPSVVRVESLTVTPLPGALPPDGAGEETLDDLGEEEELAPHLTSALETLMASEPERFPMGLLSVANRVGDGSQDLRGVVRGERVTAEEARAIATAIDDAPLVLGRLVSRDRQLAAVVLFLDPALGTGPARIEAVHAIDAWLAAHPPPRGASIHAAGIPHVRAAIQDAMIADQTFLVPLALLLCALLLYASFRWAAGVILPIAMVAMSVVCVIGTMAWVGEPLSILMNTLPTLLIIMGISEAVHVVGRYAEESRRTVDRVEAAARTLRRLMVACFLTSFTTAIGFGSLIVAQTDLLQRFGVAAALGVMVTYAILITFIPAVISYFPRPSWK